MTNEQINGAIAEARGWTDVSDKIPSPGECGGWAYGRMRGVNPEGYRVNVPDYCNDLNAMHEAEKRLNSEQWVAYGKELSRLKVFPMVHATARQRAESFLRTLGKWEE